tara:strand:- start:2963 stop:3976 length:1014 start_codon:yes stop_codon:yes gene_type:complete
MTAFLEAIQIALPHRVVTNRDLQSENPDWDMFHLEERTGVFQRHIAAEDETALDLGELACRQLATTNPGLIESVDGLIFCTETPDYPIPSNAALLHDRLALPQDIIALDINMGCSGFIHSLDVARNFILSGNAQRFLLVTGDTYSRFISPGDRATRVLFGDGAAATIIGSSVPGTGIVDTVFGANGKHFRRFYVPAGGMRQPTDASTKEQVRDQSGNVRNAEQITMQGFQVLTFFNSAVPQAVRGLLAKNGLTVEDVDLFIFHQASSVALSSITKSLGLSSDRVLNRMANTGNLVSSSIPAAYKMASDEGLIESGQRIVLCGFGVGLLWGASLAIVP